MKANNERIFFYDFLRAFAIVAVIICHCDIFFGSLNTPLLAFAHLTYHDIGRMGVPIFLMITGALLLNKDYDLSFFLKKRFSRIFYPFIFWVFIIVLGIIVVNNDYNLAWQVIIGDFSVTWYFWTLIGIYLSIPIFNSFLKDYGERGLEYFLIIWFLTIIFKSFNAYPLFSNFNLDVFAGYVGFPILGYYLSHKKFALDDVQMIVVSTVILLVSFGVYIYLDYLGHIYLIYQNVPIVLVASSFYLLFRSVNQLNSFKHIKDNFIGMVVNSLSSHSYGMYFSHVIVLKLLSMFNPKSNMLVIVMSLLLIFISWLLVDIVSRIPFLRKFSGV